MSSLVALRTGDTLRSYVAEYLSVCGGKPGTVKGKKHDLETFIAWSGDCPVENISPATLERYKEHLASLYSHTTANRDLASIRSFFGWLEDEKGYRNPARRVRGFKDAGQNPQHVFSGFTDQEREKLLAYCSSLSRSKDFKDLRNRFLILFLLHTGVRRAEAASITIDMLSSDRRFVLELRGKGDRIRSVYLNSAIHSELKAWEGIRGRFVDARSGYLFPSSTVENHRPLSLAAINHIIAVTGRKARVDNCHPHRFRHDYGRRNLKAGVSLDVLRRQMGHSDVNMTLRYTWLTQDEFALGLEQGVTARDGSKTKKWRD